MNMRIILLLLLIGLQLRCYGDEVSGFTVQSIEMSRHDGSHIFDLIRDGDKKLIGHMRTPEKSDYTIWLSSTSTLIMSDTTRDGGIDVITFMNGNHLVGIYRREADAFVPIPEEELIRQREFLEVFTEEFPIMVETAGSSEEADRLNYWKAFGNIVEHIKADGHNESPNKKLEATVDSRAGDFD